MRAKFRLAVSKTLSIRTSSIRKPLLASGRPAVRAAAIETLESRRLLTVFTVNGTSGADTIVFDGGSYTINGNFFRVTDPTADFDFHLMGGGDTISINTLSADRSVTVQGSTGNDTINIKNIDSAAFVTVLGEEDDDTVNLGGGKIASVAGTLTLGGGAGTNTLNVNDTAAEASSDGSAGTISFQRLADPDQFLVPGGSINGNINYVTFNKLNANMSELMDSVFVNHLVSGTTLTVNGNGGDEFFDVAAGNFDDNLGTGAAKAILNGGTGANEIDFNDFNEAADVRVLANGIRSNLTDAAIDFTGMRKIQANLGFDNDKFDGSLANIFLSISGLDGDDSLSGGSVGDFIDGGQGNDTIHGNGGADELDGSESTEGAELDLSPIDQGLEDDVIFGDAGNDTLRGETGFDQLSGGDGNDLLVGGGADDAYFFANATAAETDTVSEVDGGGTDRLDFSPITSSVTVDLTSDTQLAKMTNRTVKTRAAGEAAFFETVVGGSVGDSITGNAAANRLFGLGGNDTLTGGEGSDTMGGSTGNDTYKFGKALVNQTDVVQEISGEGTDDVLDFSAVPTPVNVNLNSDTLATHTNRTVKVLVPGQRNFERFIAPVPLEKAKLSGKVFNDANNNGVLDNGETGISTARVYVDVDNDKILDDVEESTFVNADGTFEIVELDDTGSATRLRVIVPSGSTQTLPASNFGYQLDFADGATNANKNFGLFTPGPTPTPTSTTFQAENGTLAGGSAKSTANSGFLGAGYVDYGGQNSSDAITVTRSAAGTVKLDFRYANGSATTRPMDIFVGATKVGSLTFAATGSFTNWQTISLSNVTLPAGTSTIKIVATSANGGPNLDQMIVTGSTTPTPTPTPTTTTLQAENAAVGGGSAVSTANSGFLGTGYVDYGGQNSFVTFSTTRSASGAVSLAFRYANGSTTSRPMDVFVGATKVGSLTFAATGSFTNWVTTTLSNVTLPAGTIAIKVIATSANGGPNLDQLVVTNNSTTPTPTPTPTSTKFEAENATFTNGTAKGSSNSGFTGTGYADFGGSGSSAQFAITGAKAGAATLALRYANGSTTNRPLSVIVNGTTIAATFACTPTGSWTTWATISITATLLAGNNTIKLIAGSATGANVDSLTVSQT